STWTRMIVVSLVSSSPISRLLLVEGGENSMTTPGDYWMTADRHRRKAGGIREVVGTAHHERPGKMVPCH
ncbi:MAG: hypothetical protein KBE28_07125, partial [Nitrospira sp.]|nr:hypothetical protein [Nitrospira sp.]MBP9634779.1 hypothetical protein [Nitrospira sp.]